MSDDFDELEEDFDALQVSMAAISYYLYRVAGCPMGDSMPGFMAWLDCSVFSPYESFCDQHEKDALGEEANNAETERESE